MLRAWPVGEQRTFFETARAAGLERLLDHIAARQGAWVTRRIDIARHWIDRFPAPAALP